MSGYLVARLVRALWLWLGQPRYSERYDRVVGGVALAVILACGLLVIPVAIYTWVSSG